MSNIKDVDAICTKFDQFLDIYEQEYKMMTIEDLLNIFKCCFFIESVAKKFDEKNCLNDFLKVLETWQNKRNKFKRYEPKVFLFACNYSLSKMIKSKMNVKNIDLAIRIYSSMQPIERFQDFLENFLKGEISYKSINKFAAISSDVKVYSSKIVLATWSNYYEIGLSDELNEMLNYKLTDYKLDKILQMHLNILSLDTENCSNLYIKSLLLQKVEEHMKIRNGLIENFWMILLFEIDTEILCIVFIKYSSVLELFMKFLNYIGTMMMFKTDNKRLKWIPNPNTFCPKITYDNLVYFIKSILTDRAIIEPIRSFIKKAQNIQSKIWSDVYNDVFLYKK